MKIFNLSYSHKETGKTYLARAITNQDYELLDPETKETQKVSRFVLKTKMGLRPDKKNSSLKSIRFSKAPRMINGKAAETKSDVS